MTTGTIVRLKEKGFGFIKPDSEGKDIFFHLAGLADVQFDDLREGDKVTFEIKNGEKGPYAVNIVRTAVAATDSTPREEELAA